MSRLKLDAKTLALLKAGGQRDSLILPNIKAMHLKLVVFIEDDCQRPSHFKPAAELRRFPAT
ncbi:hypothetical protein AO067_10420 [Pseudomonas viridiflava ICMP 13104]|uniref:Uncharacterized protein n=1 Tax=Pseudomonas viridiflava ICMP 13104 TaxID=1198305 RepID=A0A0W0H2W0_PSEVI|nr:hypothetical protein AO067_10420 [Pseudomonas viridiflava ICMP 13104]